MSIPFTLLCNGVEKSLADWGLDDLHFDWYNLAPDHVAFMLGGRPVDAASLFPFGAAVEIWQGRSAIGVGGKRWFCGRVDPWEMAGGGRDKPYENQMGHLVGPWWWLENLLYQMTYISNAGILYSTPRAVLNVAYDPVTTHWKWLTTGQQIAAALQWAIGQGAPIQIGNIAPWASPASNYKQGIYCSEVIQQMWRVESDFVGVWDYSTLPYPTIHFLKGSAAQLDPSLSPAQQALLLLAPKNIPLDSNPWLGKVRIKTRPDRIKAYVRIFYDQITTVNQTQTLTIAVDQYPNPAPADLESKFRGLDLFFDLAGAKIAATFEEDLLTSTPFDITSLAQWQIWRPELAAASVASVVILNAATTPPADAGHPAPALACRDTDNNGNPVPYNIACAFELLEGGFHDWMQFPGQKVRATAWAQVTYKAPVGTTPRVECKQLNYDFTAIALNTNNVPSNVWTFTQTVQEYAEPQPVGVAKALYLALQSNAITGEIDGEEQELSNAIGFGNCLNFITPSRPEWAALNSVVQNISGSALKGYSQIKFGEPLHLTAQQNVDLQRVCRLRVPSLNLAFLFGGVLNSGGGTVRHPRKTHAHASQASTPQKLSDAVYASPNPDTETNPAKMGAIVIDPNVAAVPLGDQAPLITISASDVLAIDALNP